MKEENANDIFAQLKEKLNETSKNEPTVQNDREAGKVGNHESGVTTDYQADVSANNLENEGYETEDSFANRASLTERIDHGERFDQNNIGIVVENRNKLAGVKNLLKPDGHYNKPVIVGIIFIVLFLLFIFMPGGNSDDETLAENQIKAEKLPSSVTEEATEVNPGSVSDSNSAITSSPGESILGNSNANANSEVPIMSAGANSNTNIGQGTYGQPIKDTKIETYTNYEPQSQNPNQIQQNPNQPPAVVPTARLNRREMSESFTVDFGEATPGETNPVRAITSPNRQISDSDIPVKTLRVMPGTRIQMALNEPFRSGIETKVQAVCLNNVKGLDGKVVIPSNSIFEFTFRPEEISGRVLARNVARVYLPEGQIGEVVGIVKGIDGFAGLTGKIIKQNEKGIGGRILGGIARVAAGRLGGEVGYDVENEINNSGITDRDSNISRSNRIVEIIKGTRFYLYVGSPE